MKVLVAEDSKLYRRMLTDSLAAWHYDVILAKDGIEALRCLRQPDPPPIAIVDCMMPGLSGLEVCRTIRKSDGPYTYVILISAQQDHQDVIRGFELGADDYIGKPFNELELRARLQVGARIISIQQQLLAVQRELEHHAQVDSLTGLWNRGAMFRRLNGEIERSKRFGLPLCVCLADLDHFKQVNDGWGHLAGDTVLHKVAEAMMSLVRGYDSVGRYGGEEFLIIAPETCAADGRRLGERVRSGVAAQTFAPPGLNVSMSIGVAEWTPDETMDELLERVDGALYLAKNRGRNRVELASAL